MIRSKCFFLPSLFLLIFLTRCANPVTPEGGPKDSKPPSVVLADPPLNSIHFNKKEIRITFNKYVQLKDQSNQVNIAPPTLRHADIRLRGKSIVIKLNDSLKSNTTYSINFGDAISDITENNILHNFIYSFSTGSYIDSLSLSGKVINAFDLVPQKDVIAELYINENDTLPLDSLPYHVKPYYLAKTNDNGEFSFHNLRNVPYLLFALKDANGDYIFNSKSEKIAFSDSLVKGVYIKPPSPEDLKKDSLAKKDTLHPKKDTVLIKKDTVGMIKKGIISPNTLLLFEETDSVQKILKADMINEDQIWISYRFPVTNPEFIPLNLPDTSGWVIPEINTTHDTVFLWSKITQKDSLYLRLLEKGKTLDTAKIDLRKKTLKKRKGDKNAETLMKLRLSTNMGDNRLNQFKRDPLIIFGYPVSEAKFSRILMVDGKDTVKPKLAFTDSIKRKLRVSYKWKEDHPYKLIIPDSIFHSFNGLSNDSLVVSFRTHSLRDFGSIRMDITVGNPSSYLIQLLDEKENVLEQRIISSSQKVKFDYLTPGKYKIKVLFDRNQNGHWDTGKFSSKLQPEKVGYYEKIIEVHANWDIEESWELK